MVNTISDKQLVHIAVWDILWVNILNIHTSIVFIIDQRLSILSEDKGVWEYSWSPSLPQRNLRNSNEGPYTFVYKWTQGL